MNRVRVYAVVIAMLVSLPASAKREVVRVEEGITVEAESLPGRTLPILTGTTTISAPPEQIAAWIGATHTYVDWMHNCEEARVVKGADKSGYDRYAPT